MFCRLRGDWGSSFRLSARFFLYERCASRGCAAHGYLVAETAWFRPQAPSFLSLRRDDSCSWALGYPGVHLDRFPTHAKERARSLGWGSACAAWALAARNLRGTLVRGRLITRGSSLSHVRSSASLSTSAADALSCVGKATTLTIGPGIAGVQPLDTNITRPLAAICRVLWPLTFVWRRFNK